MIYYKIKVKSANRISAQSVSLKGDSKDEPQNIAEKIAHVAKGNLVRICFS